MSQNQGAAIAALLLTYTIFFLIAAVLVVIARWHILAKAKQPSWHALIPFLGFYDLFKIAWERKYFWFYIVLAFFNGITLTLYQSHAHIFLTLMICLSAGMLFYLQVMLCLYLSKAFGKGSLFGLGLVVAHPVFILLLGLGNATYVADSAV